LVGPTSPSFSGTVTGKAHGDPVEGVEIDAYADDIRLFARMLEGR